MFAAGEPVPWFAGRTLESDRFHFHTVAGQFVVISFLGSLNEPNSRSALSGFLAESDVFDDENVLFFGVTNDSTDQQQRRLPSRRGIRYFLDFDGRIRQAYQNARGESRQSNRVAPFTLVLDQRLRVLADIPLGDDGRAHAARVLGILRVQGDAHAPEAFAPVLAVPRIFEPPLCRALIDYYRQHGGAESGFVVDSDGQTVTVLDHAFKRRRDQEIHDQQLRRQCMVRIHDRLAPEIAKAFQFRATRMERYIVCCYDAAVGGYFHAHRDNTTKGTMHRRFAVTINLNREEFEGGGLRFPEFGPRVYTAETGGAIVFSCSLLHRAMPVTKGQRFAFVPFLYDDAAAQIREANLHHVSARRINKNNAPESASAATG